MNKLLFIRYKKSKNIFEGGEQCSQRNYNILAQHLGEDNIYVYYVHDETKKKTIFDYLLGVIYFFRNYFFGLIPKRMREISNLAHSFDYVFIDRSVFGAIAKHLKNEGYKGKIITFFHNVEVPYFKARTSKYNPIKPLIYRCIDNNDKFSCSYSDKIITLNQRDTDEINKRYGRVSDVMIPIAFKDVYNDSYLSREELTSVKPKCLFLGAYFAPNNEGIIWFVKNVLPYVDIDVKIVGKGMSKLLKEEPILLKDIEVISDAPSLLSYFEWADIMLLPIFSGSGMKVKTCESLMYAKNIIASQEALEGYDLDYDKMGALCNTKDEFITAINDFKSSPRPKYNVYSREVYLEKYSEQAVADLFIRVLN